MKKKKFLTLAVLVIAMLTMVGLSSCGNNPKEAPSKDQVQKVMKDKGFEEIKVPKDMVDPDAKTDLLYGKDTVGTFGYLAYQDEEKAKLAMKSLQEDMEGVLKASANGAKPKIKDADEDKVISHLVLYKTQGIVIVRQDKTIFYVFVITPDEKAFDNGLKLVKESFKDLGYKNII